MGGKTAEAGRIHSPRQIVSPCLDRIRIFNHLDFARNSFELRPKNTAFISKLYKPRTTCREYWRESGAQVGQNKNISYNLVS